jgi:hypothetical protein
VSAYGAALQPRRIYFGWFRDTVYLNSFAYDDTRPEAALTEILTVLPSPCDHRMILAARPLARPDPKELTSKSARCGKYKVSLVSGYYGAGSVG